MSRAAFADHIRAFKRIPQSAVAAFDAFAEAMGFPIDEEPASTPDGRLAPSDAAFDIIKEFEGYHLALSNGGCAAYPDPATGGRPWTIGFGTTGPDVNPGTVWTRAEAEARLKHDVCKFGRGVAELIGDAPTEQHEFDALTSFSYNVGLNALRRSALLKKHKAGDKRGAAQEFARWRLAAGKVMKGLVRRRAAEAALYRGER